MGRPLVLVTAAVSALQPPPALIYCASSGDALDADEMRELVLDAWRMVVPQRVAQEVLGPPAAGHEPGRTG